MKLNTYKNKKFRLKHALWFLVRGTFFKLSPQPLNGWRCFLLRLFGAKIGKKVIIRPSAKIHCPWNLKIGNYSWIGEEALLYSLDKIIIGKNCCISQRAFLCTGSHDYKKETFDLITKPIIIEDNVWVSADCFVHPGIRICSNSIVGTKSNVINNIDSNTINVGNPCKFIKRKE